MRRRALAGGVVIVSVGVLGGSSACGQPSAQDLWNRPAQSSVQDAHASVEGSGNGVTFRGDGLVVFKPRTAMSLHLQTEAGALPAQVEVLEVGGAAYMRAAAGQRWTRSATPPPDPTWRSGADPQLVGQDRVDGVRTWHLRASRGRSPLDMWVRISDGYPLRVVTANGAGATFTFAFDRFNTGGRLLPPPAVEVKPAPRTLSGHVGDPLTLGGARITVLSFDGDAQPAEDAAGPRPGNRFVVVEVTVENVGGDALSTFLDWRLTDAAGYAWMEALSVREPSFPGGELAPGDASRGYLTYEVSRSSSRLTLSVKLDDDTASFGLG